MLIINHFFIIIIIIIYIIVFNFFNSFIKYHLLIFIKLCLYNQIVGVEIQKIKKKEKRIKNEEVRMHILDQILMRILL
jgi:hypothetical protein